MARKWRAWCAPRTRARSSARWRRSIPDMAVPSPHPSSFVLLLLVPLVLWRMYSRIRRLVGRQRLSRIRPWLTLTLFPALLALLGYAARAEPERLAFLALGVASGAALGVFGLKRTKFEPTPQGLFYTPNLHLGI